MKRSLGICCQQRHFGWRSEASESQQKPPIVPHPLPDCGGIFESLMLVCMRSAFATTILISLVNWVKMQGLG